MRMLVLALAFVLFPLVAVAQDATDARWNTWLGCWDLILENTRDTSGAPPQAPEPTTQARDATRPQVCVQPANGGVTLSTRVGAQTPVEQTIVADGADHPIDDGDCRGTQRAEWSQNGRRLFSRATLVCASDKGGSRRVSGMAILGQNGTWTDIQAVDIDGHETVRLRRYRRAASQARTTPARGDARLSLEDVKEASAHVSAAALEAALVETGSIFALSGKALIALQDAGVPSSVTDLMIALSYPDRFVVERRAGTDLPPPAMMLADDPFLAGWAFGYPMWSEVYGFYSPFCSAFSPYFYSPFSYYYSGGCYPRYYGGSTVVIIDGGGGGGGSLPPSRPSGAGRVVDGLGYTRVRPREAESTAASQAGGSNIASSAGGSSSSSSSSSGGGGVSSQGFSSSGSSGDTGRTAQPR